MSDSLAGQWRWMTRRTRDISHNFTSNKMCSLFGNFHFISFLYYYYYYCCSLLCILLIKIIAASESSRVQLSTVLNDDGVHKSCALKQKLLTNARLLCMRQSNKKNINLHKKGLTAQLLIAEYVSIEILFNVWLGVSCAGSVQHLHALKCYWW